jgi:ferredoxin
MAYVIDDRCTKCGACLFECPTNSIIEGAKIYIIDTDTCADHAACVAVCPVNAIQPKIKEEKDPKAQEQKGKDAKDKPKLKK